MIDKIWKEPVQNVNQKQYGFIEVWLRMENEHGSLFPGIVLHVVIRIILQKKPWFTMRVVNHMRIHLILIAHFVKTNFSDYIAIKTLFMVNNNGKVSDGTVRDANIHGWMKKLNLSWYKSFISSWFYPKLLYSCCCLGQGILIEEQKSWNGVLESGKRKAICAGNGERNEWNEKREVVAENKSLLSLGA